MTRTRFLAHTLLVAVVLLGVVPFAPPAQAASTYICTGYAGCKEKGYPNSGYKANSKKMWWRMYTGHNCTNYVAYRLVKGGMSPVRPWEGSGNASNWGKAMKSITNQTPMVGSVAWWNAGDGVGSSGHVAYVEEVVSATTIVISEDSWSGDFHWRRISKSSSSWPTGFVHFNDRAVANTAAPTITGTPAVGAPLTAKAGTWTSGATLAYQWLANGKAIAGATSATLTPTVGMLGQQLSVRVVATKRGYVSGSAASVRTAAVAPGTMASTAAPAVSGTSRVDEVLTVRAGTWSPKPKSTTIQWYADGKAIPGATGRTLRLGQDLFRKVITARMTARLDGYKVSTISSAPTAAVAAGLIEFTQPYALGGVPKLGGRLTVTPGKADPADSAVTYTWLRDGHPIAGATGKLAYDLGLEDVGHQVSVRVGLSHTGYLDKSVTLAAAGIVTTVPDLRVTATGKRGRAVVALRVSARGVAAATGRATVTIGGHEGAGRVVDGRMRVVVPELRPGTWKVKVAYDGTGTILPGRVQTTVRVLK